MNDAQKRPRNTTELPISVAIARLRELDGDMKKEREERATKILARVPQEFRAHVAEKAGFKIPDAPADIPDALREPVPPRRPGERLEVSR